MENISLDNKLGMYGFPKVEFSDRAIKTAKMNRVPVDSMYCIDMLNETGIMTAPGSEFGKTGHFRITNLVMPKEDMIKTLDQLSEFNSKFHNKCS